MRIHYFSPPKKKLRLKRSRSKIFIIPLILLIPTIVLSIISLSQQRGIQSIKAEVVQPAGLSDSGNEAEGKGKAEAAGSFDQDSAVPMDSAETIAGNAKDLESLQKISRRIRKGETISSLLSEHLKPGQIYTMSKRCRDVYSLRRIKAGHDYRLYLDDTGLKRFEYDIDTERKLCVHLDSSQIQASMQEITYRVQCKVVNGTIESSLFESLSATGEADELAIALAEIFAWDVDFIRDIRSGDSFRLVVEKRYRFGEFAGYGKILAAEFVNQGRSYHAFLFDDGSGRAEYYDDDGEAVRKTFLKAPLNFTRISSGYTWRRKHPILDVVRPHLGIDYAAPRGTPIKSVADGKILSRAYTRQAGNYVKIRHPNGYVTIYNHMSSFARGLKPGKEIAQGEVIGYVGTTGLSTGPHLDFRAKRYGKYVNPLKIKSEPVKPVPKSKLAEFRKRMRSLAAILEKVSPMYAYAGEQQEDPALQ